MAPPFGKMMPPPEIPGLGPRIRRYLQRLPVEALILGDGLVFDSEGRISLAPEINKLLWLSATSQSPGNITLADATNWGQTKAIIQLIRVITVSTDWDLTLYPDGDFNEVGYMPSLSLVRNRYKNVVLATDIPYWDGDGTANLYMKFTDNAGASTADIYVFGTALR